jgi:hypothetical protein
MGAVEALDGPSCVVVRHIVGKVSLAEDQHAVAEFGWGWNGRLPSRRVVAGRTVGGLSCLEHGFDIWEFGRMRTDTVNTITTATTSTTRTPQAARPHPSPPRPKPARISVARQVKQQRRGYAAAVLRTLARTHRGRPATQIRATLRSSLAPLGVRLAPARLRELADDIAAGRPVELP